METDAKPQIKPFKKGPQAIAEIFDKLHPLSKLIDVELLRNDPNTAIKNYKNFFYAGSVEPNTKQREGCGICIYDNGRQYEGSWHNDKRHGMGHERFGSGNTYAGEYANGRGEGHGVYKWTNGDQYEGEFSEGLKHGYGVWTTPKGETYSGEWQRNFAHGYGVHTWPNGDRYEGEWYKSLKHGQGQDTYANGDLYIGQYVMGFPHGQGSYKWANGNTYIGSFEQGKKHGNGVWFKPENQASYTGQYRDDMKNGRGQYEWASGGYYTGEYQNDYKCGYGEMKWPDKSSYRGYWKDGKQNGPGIMTQEDGTQKIGIFRNNLLVEHLTCQHQIAEVPEGDFRQQLVDYLAKKEEPAKKQEVIVLYSDDMQSTKETDQQLLTMDAQTQCDHLVKPIIKKPREHEVFDAKKSYEDMIQPRAKLPPKSQRAVLPPLKAKDLLYHDFEYVGYESKPQQRINRFRSQSKQSSSLPLLEDSPNGQIFPEIERRQHTMSMGTLQDNGFISRSRLPASIILSDNLKIRKTRRKITVIKGMTDRSESRSKSPPPHAKPSTTWLPAGHENSLGLNKRSGWVSKEQKV